MGPVPGYFNADRKARQERRARHLAASWPDKVNDPDGSGLDRDAGTGSSGRTSSTRTRRCTTGRATTTTTAGTTLPTPPTPQRRGLGMIVDVRALQWSQASVADAVFFIQEFKNDGTKDIKKTGVTLWLADFVGGDGDSQDDSPSFDLILDIAFSLDADGKSSNPAFSGVPVGCCGDALSGNTRKRDRQDRQRRRQSRVPASAPKSRARCLQSRIPGTCRRSRGDQIDNNRNGLIDEDSTYIAFGQQRGVGFADGIDNDGNGESGSR